MSEKNGLNDIFISTTSYGLELDILEYRIILHSERLLATEFSDVYLVCTSRHVYYICICIGLLIFLYVLGGREGWTLPIEALALM